MYFFATAYRADNIACVSSAIDCEVRGACGNTSDHMPRSRSAARLLLLLTLPLGLCAGASEPPRLVLQQPLAAALRPGGSSTFLLALAQRDCAFAQVRGPGRVMRARLLDASGRRTVRSFTSRVGGPLELNVCVELAGRYQIVLSADAPGRYELELTQILTRPSSPALQPTASAARVTSPRLAQLQASLPNDPGALDTFWRETEQAGTPLVEPGDADNLLVTFLYRATSTTGSVAISWPMWSDAFSQTAFARLPGTDVFWKSVRLPRAARLSYQLAIDAPRDAKQDIPERALRAVSRADPRNLHPMTPDPNIDAFAQRSVLALPDAPPERWLERPSVPRGRVQHETIVSATLGNTHALSVYLPLGYSPRGRYPLVIFFDGEQYLDELRSPQLLDRLIAAHAITPLVAAFVHNASPDARAEELPCNPRFAQFVATELLPQLQARYALSRDPHQVALAGSSFGGLAASYIALEHPELFGKVLSQSGSYWWSFPRGAPSFDGKAEPGWLRRRYQQQPRAAIELYLSAGTFETDAAGGGVLEHNRLQRDALRALGYTVAYQELVAGHDPLSWRASLPDALIALFAPAR